jgi:23S rRNA (cytosine1962-C5)-methyltransferase
MKDRERTPKALLLFAYTGIASMACRKAGADTFHVEVSKRTLTWARKNMEANRLEDIRWVLEDALKFVKREQKRGKEYDAIVMDTPSFGRGPGGEIWKAEELAADLFERTASLLSADRHLLIGNLYSERPDMEEMERTVRATGKKKGSRAILQDLYIPSREGNDIPGGHCFYLRKG